MSTTVTRGFRAARPRRTTPSSIVSAAAGVTGVILLVIGVVALARGELAGLTSPAVAVGPFTRTPLMGLLEIAMGMIALASAAQRDVPTVAGLAVTMGVAGLVWLIESAAFAGLLGISGATGALYVAVAVGLLGAVFADRSRQRVV